ncbi:MAG: RHS repeat protein, partial [Gammaproteobacteria bacterium]|nr:RHS repeat protein [Gammaproteobacteria bacterium]
MTVAIVSGEALGLFHSSASQLGTTGTGFGAAGDQLYVNANTGNLVIQRQDQVVKGHGVDASVVRTYNSQGNLNDSIGGQYFNFQQHVVAPGVVNTAPKVRVTADGYEQSFTYVSANHYVSEEGAGAHDTLNYENGNWVYTEGSSGLRETYENANNGQLLTRTDREGYGQRFEYDTSGRLQYIIDEGKQVTRLSYEDSSTRVSKLENYRVEDTDNPGSPLSNSTASLIQYAYYEDGRLKRVTVDLTPYKQEASDTDRLKNTYTTLYAYDGASSRISSIHQGVGNTPENAAALFFVYDGVGRITELRMGEGDEARITRFAYQKDLNDPTGQSDYTEVTDLLDYRREGDTYIPVQTATTRYRYDANGQLTKVEPPADEFGRQQVTSYTYTDHGDVRQIRDGDNHTVRYHYDYDETDVTSNDGLRLWQMDNDGNAIRWIYNDNQQVAAEISYQGADVNTLDDTFAPTGAEVTRFIYNTKGQLRFTLSPKDSEGKARVQETRYEDIDDTQRRIIRSYQYLTTYTVPSAWDLTLDQISTPDSTYRAALEAWVDFAPQANSAQMTETHLDFRGQVSQVRKSVTQIAIDNTGAANDTIGSETRIQYFIYNEYGRLIQQIDGKTIADSGPYETSETLASLVGYSVGDGQTLFVYDGLGRLIATALATNNSDDHSATNSLDIGSELGNTNALIEEDRINANTLASRFNSVTHYGVNTDGQQQVTTLYANGLTQTQTYNSAGELLSSVRFDSSKEEISPEDANFGETTYRYDDAGRLRMVIDPEGVRSHTLYDDGGKLIATVDGSGALTEYSYDNSGNQTRTIGYANYLNVTQLNRLATQQGSELVLLSPSLSSIRPSFSPDDRIVHSLYDEANQLAYQIDGEGYVTEYQYDGAGRLTNTIEHGTPYLGYDYVSSDGVAISAPDYDALKAFSQYNYSAEGSYSLSQGAWEQGIRHETDATILTHSISSIADNLSGLVVSDAYNDLYLDHGISLDHILADTSQVDTWIQRPIKQLVGKATWQANFSEAGNLPVYYGFTGIDAQSVGRVSSTEAQPYFTVENGQLKLTPKNIAYGKDFWWNNSEQVQFSGARQYDTRETFEFSYTFSETDSLSSNKDILLGMSDENNQTLGFSLEGSEIRLSDEAGTDGIYKFPIVRQQGATYRLHMIRENGIITATVYQVDTDAGTETELAQKVLSAEEQYEWGEGLHSVIELWGKTSGSILIHDIQETGHAFELPYDVKINVDNAGDIVPVYGQLHNEITDFSQPQEKTNWGFISEGEVNNLGEPGYTVNEAQETDGLMFSHNQGKLSVRSITTASEGKAVRLVSNQTYHRNAALPLTFRWEISGGTNSNYSRAFFGFRDEDNNTGGVKLVRDDAFVATGVKGKDVGALPANRDRDATQVIELVIIGSRALVYYYPKGSTERQLFDTHEVFDTSNYVTPFIEVWGDTNTNYNKAAITVESFQVIGLTEWDATLAVEDTETIQHIGGRSLQGVYTNDISTLEKLEARLVRSDVLNQISGTNYTEEWVETYLDIGTYDGRLDVFDGEVLGAGEYHIEVRTTTTGDAAPGPATFLENADGSLYTYTEQYRLQENPYGQGATLKHYFTTQNSDDPNYLNLDLYNRIETQLTNIDTGETTVSVTNIDYPEQYSGYVLLDQSAPLDTGLYEITIIKHGPGALQSAGDIQETFTSQVGVSQTYTHTIGVPVDDFYNLDNTQALTLTYWKNDSGRTHSGINQTPETLTLTLNTQTQRYETSISNLVAGQYGYQIQYTQLDETELATLQGELRGDNSTGNDALLTSQHRYINHQTEETGEGLHLSNYLTLATRESGDGLSDVERTGITHLSATVRYADSTQVVTQAITDIDGWNLTANESSFAAHSGQLMLSQGQALSAGKYQVDVAATLANGDV